MYETEAKKEQAIIVGVNINDRKYFKESMDELINLLDACDIETIGSLEQNLEKVNPSLYLGTGKVEELKELAHEKNASLIVFNNELSPSQLKNLQKILDLPILDRTSVILQIFSSRAKSKEAKLQVEVAKLEYMLPRLVGLHTSLGRQGGGSGISNKGSGETKLELDRRRIENRLTELNKELEQISTKRKTQRKQRVESNLPLVCLVGYTNAGKSTLLNSIMDNYGVDEEKKVEEKDMLFATLDTSVRKIEMENNKTFLLSDTVGFVSELPHNLVKAFRSTLEEVKNADLLLHVIDYSDENYERNMEVTLSTLKEIAADNIPIINVYNKSDLKGVTSGIIDDNNVYISALRKMGIKELIKLISTYVFLDYVDAKLLIPYDKGSILSYLNENATILNTEYLENGTCIYANMKLKDYNKYIEFVISE